MRFDVKTVRYVNGELVRSDDKHIIYNVTVGDVGGYYMILIDTDNGVTLSYSSQAKNTLCTSFTIDSTNTIYVQTNLTIIAETPEEVNIIDLPMFYNKGKNQYVLVLIDDNTNQFIEFASWGCI